MRRVLIPVLILFLLTAMLPATCLADTTTPTDSLTVDQAVTLALANRTDVQTASLNLQAANISSDLAWDNAQNALIPGTNQYSSSGVGDWNQIYNADYNLQSAQSNYDTKLESVKLGVYQKYYAVVSGLDSNEASRLASEQAADKLKISELRSDLGMDTKLTVIQAQQAAVSAASNYTVSQQSLDQKYFALMDYIGLPTDQRPALTKELTFTPINIPNPESKFSDIVDKSPSVWLAEKSLLLTQETSTSSVTPEGDLSDINNQKSDLAVVSTRDSMLQVTRNLYYNILSNEASYNTAVQSAKAADEALRVAKLMNDLGMGTKLDVTAAEIAANNAHQSVDSLSYQHAIMVMGLDEPWAYSSGS